MDNKTLQFVRALPKESLRIMRREASFRNSRPTTSTLFLTYRCNSQCKTCTLWKRPKEDEMRREIGLDGWKVVIDKLADAGIRETEIFGGNVFLRKDIFIPVVEYLRKKDFTIHLPTNQIGLDDEIARAIVSFVDCVYISTDGVGEYQDSIRGQKGAAQRSETAIARLLRLREGNGKRPRLVCNTTVSRYNAGILEEIVKYAVSHRFDEVHLEYVGEFTEAHIERSIIDGLKPTPYYVRQGDSALVDQAGARFVKENLRRIKKKYSRKGFKISAINIDSLSEQNMYEGTIPHGKCYVERTEVTIDPAGNVIICPFINNYMIGNLVEGSLDEIWNNAKHLRFRDYQNNNRLELCAHCILGVQRNPGVFKSIERIYYR